MPVTKEELARRLRAAREACSMKQEDVARHLGLSRPTIAQIELGNRAVTSIELDKLAYFFGRDIREFLGGEFRGEDALVALFRRHPEVPDQEQTVAALRQCIALGREITSLEGMLGIDREVEALPSYVVRTPGKKWEAVQSGERVAGEERRRLGLGTAPLPNIVELLETQGVRTAQVALPEDLSGLTLVEPEVGVFVVVNRSHHFLRRRFSFAHEYCHVVLDREQRGAISRATDRESLAEVRANAFAAEFLMPKAGVGAFVHGLGKGRPSRIDIDIFDELEARRIQARPAPGTQVIGLHDVVLLAHHFGVSRISALYRLKNLRLVTEPEFEALQQQDEQGLSKSLARLLDLPDPEHENARNEFRHRFLALGLEAFRRGEITRAKLRELAEMVEVADSDLGEFLVRADLMAEEGGGGGALAGDD